MDAERNAQDMVATVAAWTYNARHYQEMISFEPARLWAALAAADPAFDQILAMTAAGADDTVVDVGCGPGLMACQFAPHVKWVHGVDAVPAMTRTGARLCDRAGVTNVSWLTGAVPPLPLATASATILTCRLGLHHMNDPAGVMGEMWRVCVPGGKVLVIDQVRDPSPAKAARYDEWERVRDPSHKRLLSVGEIRETLSRLGAGIDSVSFIQREGPLADLLTETPHLVADEALYRKQLRALQEEDIFYRVWDAPGGWRYAALDAVILAAKRK